MQDWKHFLSRVWGDTKGWAFLAYAGGGKFHQRAFLYPDQLDILVANATRLNTWANVYFCPHLLSKDERRKENAMPLTALWVDKDSGSIADLVPKPTVCWETSTGRHQAVWLLEEPIDPREAEKVNRVLTYKTKSDKGGWHLGKIIRLPGSINYKYAQPFTGLLLWDDGPVYTRDTILPRLREDDSTEEVVFPAVEDKTDISKSLPNTVLPSYTEALSVHGKNIPALVWDLLNQTPVKDESWSDNLWKIERLLCEAGLPIEAVYVLAKGSPWNKYARDKRPDLHLWQEVCKAYSQKSTYKSEDKESLPWATLDTLLVHSERPTWLVEDFWIESNVGWIAGVGKSYKSTLSLDLALSVASGSPFLGKYKVLNPGPVLMVQEEDPLWRVAHRLQVMSVTKGIARTVLTEDETGLTVDLSDLKIPLYTSIGGRFLFDDKEKIAALERAIEQYRPRMVILDPFFMMASGKDEYKAGEVTPILTLLKTWRDRYGCAIAVVHHYRKGTGEAAERLYGSMALYAWSENSLFVDRTAGENKVTVTRDIKDAESSKPITITFHDIDTEYTFTAVEEGPKKTEGKHSVNQILANLQVGEQMAYRTIVNAANCSEKTVERQIGTLEELGYVSSRKESNPGRGGTRKIITLVSPIDEYSEQALITPGELLLEDML